MDLKEFVIAAVKPESYYAVIFPGWNPRNKAVQKCIWHDDGKPSLSVGLDNGGAKCHGCGIRIGNIVHFEAETHNISERDAAKNIYARFLHPIIPAQEIERLERNLKSHPRFIEWIGEDCGLDEVSIERFHLGLDLRSRRVTFPIRDRFGNWTNIRHYLLPRHRHSGTQAKIYNREGYGYLELFPWSAIKSYNPTKPIFLMKAEKDTMLGIQLGLQCVCTTNGENSWNDEWNELFQSYDVAVCGDNDKAGIEAADKRFAILQGAAKFACQIVLPFSRKSSKLKDFADWILYDKGNKPRLLNLYEALKRPAHSKIPPSERLQLPEFYSQEFQDLISVGRRTDMLNHIVRVKAIVSAKTDRTYTVPYKFYVSSTSSPRREWQIPVGRELLRLIKTSDDAIVDYIKKDLLKTKRCKLEPIEHITATEVEVIPVSTIEKDSPYVTQRCFFFGEKIEANVPYELEIVPTTEIRSQETVGIITKAKSIASTIDEFVFDNKQLERLETFRPSEGGIYESLCNIATDIAHQYTQIYNRDDWHLAVLLSWCCPLEFNFPNEGLQRGWINTLGIGDTKTGKSETVESLQKLFNCGNIISAENCTFVGLVGGAVKMAGGQFMLRWGRIPLSNRGLVVIEELSGLSITEISNMSEVRSSGVARLDKGGLSSETSARTRLICLSNVRGRERNLAQYISGVKAIQDLIGHGEDIARFDLVCTLISSEVSTDIINQDRSNQAVYNLLDQEDFRLLIRFIWALKPHQIEITQAAYKTCLDYAKKLGQIYHWSCPLFLSADGRLKLARIATAIACFQFAWNGQKIVVTEAHVEAAVAMLQTLYDKPSLGYREYSEQAFYRDGIQHEDETDSEVLSVLSGDKRSRVCNYLLHAITFTRDELCQVANLQIMQADRMLSRMITSNIINKGIANTWQITPVGKIWMQKHMKPKSIPQTYNGNGKHSVNGSVRNAKSTFAALWNKTRN